MNRAPVMRPVVFDAYGTLFDPLSLAEPLERAFPGRGTDLASTWRATQLRHTWLRSLMADWADFDGVTRAALGQALAAAGLDADDDLADELLAAYRRLPAYPDVATALAALAPDRPRAILTNGTRATVSATVRTAGLEADLPTVLSADDVGIYKPAPAVYAMATAHFAVEPGEVTFVSGNSWDCTGAAAFGFRVVRVLRSPEAAEGFGSGPFATLDDLTDLHSVLDG